MTIHTHAINSTRYVIVTIIPTTLYHQGSAMKNSLVKAGCHNLYNHFKCRKISAHQYG